MPHKAECQCMSLAPLWLLMKTIFLKVKSSKKSIEERLDETCGLIQEDHRLRGI